MLFTYEYLCLTNIVNIFFGFFKVSVIIVEICLLFAVFIGSPGILVILIWFEIQILIFIIHLSDNIQSTIFDVITIDL